MRRLHGAFDPQNGIENYVRSSHLTNQIDIFITTDLFKRPYNFIFCLTHPYLIRNHKLFNVF